MLLCHFYTIHSTRCIWTYIRPWSTEEVSNSGHFNEEERNRLTSACCLSLQHNDTFWLFFHLSLRKITITRDDGTRANVVVARKRTQNWHLLIQSLAWMMNKRKPKRLELWLNTFKNVNELFSFSSFTRGRARDALRGVYISKFCKVYMFGAAHLVSPPMGWKFARSPPRQISPSQAFTVQCNVSPLRNKKKRKFDLWVKTISAFFPQAILPVMNTAMNLSPSAVLMSSIGR